MHRTPAAIQELLRQAGYEWDEDADGWHRPGEPAASLATRVLDGSIAGILTREQIVAWIRAGERPA